MDVGLRLLSQISCCTTVAHFCKMTASDVVCCKRLLRFDGTLRRFTTGASCSKLRSLARRRSLLKPKTDRSIIVD
ncbi:hypothetical protein T01_363 [Trichinella spiralis]|uniref:Uncharacterized protein n=1 Tax=Trichinella spiralis TaxID=6334 RepID=A0A0V1B9Z7_TRISP|nr:hypothetical protein T01_363 [Trichinella spiralis]